MADLRINPATGKKITKAHFKSFIAKNRDVLLIRVKSRFDGMEDGVRSTGESGMTPAKTLDEGRAYPEHDLGVQGVWLVGGGRDYFYHHETETHVGIEYSNSCGSGVIAIAKDAPKFEEKKAQKPAAAAPSAADGLSPSIKYMEMDRIDDGVMVTVYYRHAYLQDPKTIKAVVLISESEVSKNHGGCEPVISDYFFEVGVLLGLEPGTTVNWKRMSDSESPHRVFWRATDYS